MSVPPLPQLEQAAKKLVWDAVREDRVKELTPRLVRQQIEKALDLQAGALDSNKYKSALKAATVAALNESPPPEEIECDVKPVSRSPSTPKRKRAVKEENPDSEVEEPSTPKPRRKSRSSRIRNSNSDDEGSSKKKRRISNPAPVRTEDSGDEDSEEELPQKKQNSKEMKKGNKAYKSLEFVPTSDMEQDEPSPVKSAGPTKKATASTGKAIVKKSKSPPKKSPKKTTAAQVLEEMEEQTDDFKSESQPTMLIDEPPKRKRKSKGDEKEPTKITKYKEKKNAKSSAPSSTDDATIKRLKSLVLACGVRKVWSKVFQGLDTPQQQIKKLKEILNELGMSGRMSLEQAKAIKAKRELAQELEDVQEFEKTVLGRTSRSRSEASTKKQTVEPDSSDGEGDEDDSAPTKRPRMSAQKSILAFLADQSDDEE